MTDLFMEEIKRALRRIGKILEKIPAEEFGINKIYIITHDE